LGIDMKNSLAAAFAGFGALAAGSGYAFDFQNADGTFTGSWDTTISYGQAWRVESRDCRLIGTANGGCGRSPNIDDGNLNYGTGLYSAAFKAVTELSLNYKQVGLFVRGSGLFDTEVDNVERIPLADDAKDLVEEYQRLLDAFVYGRFSLGGRDAELRVGSQVVSWGESTFIQNGLNTINHFDVAALRVPGSELKEAFLPQELVSFSTQLSQNVSAQAIYLLSWDDTEPEPVGSYFSTNDFVPDGGEGAFLGFGRFSDQGVDFRPLGGPFIPGFQRVRVGERREPDDEGQYGVNLRWYLPNFNNGTEIGFYFLNYHSRLPLISGRTGTVAGRGNAVGTLAAVSAAAQGIAAGLPTAAAIATGAAVGAARAAAAGGTLTAAEAQAYATIGANTLLARSDVTGQATNLAVHEYAKSASVTLEFPEDIKLYGVSFNTQLQQSGIALQGEVSYRQDVPLQFDDVELLFAALTPFEAAAFAAQGLQLPPTCLPGAASTFSRCNQLGAFGLNQDIRGYGLHDTWQFQFTATKTFTNLLRAAQMVVVFESAVSYVDGLPNKTTGGPVGRGLRYNGPGTSVSGNPELARLHFNEVEPLDRFPDSTAWGYRLAGRLEYPNLVGPWNLVPRFSWQQDVEGTSPGPGGNFVEGRYGLTLGVGANLQAKWELDLSWTAFGGAGRYNELADRDFIAAAVRYSF
jgi:hypothetical protein